jgi:Omp85 superfamily domain
MTKAVIALLLVATAGKAWAQDTTITIRPTAPGEAQPATLPQLPADVALHVVQFYNAATTIRLAGSIGIPAARGVDGDLAILGGPVMVAGRVGGTLVVINGDLRFAPGASVGGDVLVVGGVVRGAAQASIAGQLRTFGDPLRYRREEGLLVYAPERAFQPPSWLRQIGFDQEGRGNHAGLLLALAGTYNRVEGLPILFGPRVDLRVSSATRFQAGATAIFRTSDMSLNNGDIGYRARGEFVFGDRQGANLGVGVRGFDLVAPVEPWPLKEFEVGWAAVLFHHDYRDYYRRHGGALFATWRRGDELAATAEYRGETESSLEARNPWTLFRSGAAWRVNPPITDGRYRSVVLSFRLDTRNDRGEPSTGWWVSGEYDLGWGRDITGQLAPVYCGSFAGPCAPPALTGGTLDFRRVAFDVRRYLRLSPTGRLNLRLAGGGWVGGDPLPLQQRLSLGYPDPLPGYGFRQFACDPGALAGSPALCDRALVAQAEFRTHLGLDFGPKWASDWGNGADQYEPFHVSGPDLVVFADAGSAWAVSRGGLTGPDVIPPDRLPTLGSYRTDIGLGLDFGPLGFYLAKPLNQADRTVTFTVRMGRRF